MVGARVRILNTRYRRLGGKRVRLQISEAGTIVRVLPTGRVVVATSDPGHWSGDAHTLPRARVVTVQASQVALPPSDGLADPEFRWRGNKKGWLRRSR